MMIEKLHPKTIFEVILANAKTSDTDIDLILNKFLVTTHLIGSDTAFKCLL
jgi:hypothetical protein